MEAKDEEESGAKAETVQIDAPPVPRQPTESQSRYSVRDRLYAILQTERNANDGGYRVSLSPSFAGEIIDALDGHADALAACQEFVRKCDCGEARSVRSYAQMSAAIAKAEGR